MNSFKAKTQQQITGHNAVLSPVQQAAVLKMQQAILEMVVQDCEDKQICDSLCKMAEALLDNSVATILVKDKSGGVLHVLSAPSVPQSGIEALEGIVPGPQNGSCANAIFRNEPVYVTDTLTDVRWLNSRKLATDFNICSCWSMPIRNAAGEAISSFALSSFEHRQPSEFHKQLLEIAAHIASIILNRSEQQALIKGHENRLQLLAMAFKNAAECIFITDKDNNIVEINPAFKKIFGYSEQQVLGKNPSMLDSDRHDRLFYSTLWAAVKSDGAWQGEIWSKDADGKEVPLWLSISAIEDGQGVVQNYLAICSDLTQLKQQQRKLEFLAYKDSLTGLDNRQGLFERTEHAIALAARTRRQLAILFLDIDRFKNLNDTFGHTVGDEVLVQLARRIQAGLRSQDSVARLGGDDFVAMVENIESPKAVYHIADKILQELRAPLNCQGHDFLLSGSIGIAMYPTDGEDTEQLLKHADTAMYKAKETGGGGISFYESALTEKAEAAFTIEVDLHKALQNSEFELYYQPKVNATTRKITGLEALIRWNHPKKGQINPNQFIPIAEETGLIIPIGEWVLSAVLEQQRLWRQAGRRPLPISVNISGRQLYSDSIESLVTMLNESQVPSHLIELELTETFLMHEPDMSTRQLERIRGTGVGLAIDDFGCGYSSLEYLKRFKVDKLKIDRALIRDIELDEDDHTIIAAIINLAHNLGMSAVAEGVETDGQMLLLQQLGCDELQGYFFCRPQKPAQLVQQGWV